MLVFCVHNVATRCFASSYSGAARGRPVLLVPHMAVRFFTCLSQTWLFVSSCTVPYVAIQFFMYCAAHGYHFFVYCRMRFQLFACLCRTWLFASRACTAWLFSSASRITLYCRASHQCSCQSSSHFTRQLRRHVEQNIFS